MENKYNIVLAIPVKNCSQFLLNLCKEIEKLDYPKENLSVMFLENDSTDNSWASCLIAISYLSKYKYRSLGCVKKDMGFHLSHTSRHLPEYQAKRLDCLNKIRQNLVDISLLDNDYLFFIDADYIKIPVDILDKLLNAKADIVVPILCFENGRIYDFTTCILREGVCLNVPQILEKYPNEDYVEVDLVNAPFMARRETFEKIRFDCGGGDQEGPCFSRQAVKLGYKCVAAMNCPIIHANIAGDLPNEKS